MTDEIIIVSPELSSGGIGDYTRRLLDHLPPCPRLRLIVLRDKNNPAMLSRGKIEEIEANAGALRERLPAGGGKVFVQYSGYGFHRFGYPRWLINALLDWKKESQGFLAIMFHEIWTFWPIWDKNYLIQQLHRRGIGKLLRVADRILTSTPRQAEELAALWPRRDIQVLPVGSNIPRTGEGEGERQSGVALLFGLQFSRIRALRKMETELQSLSDTRQIRKIVAVGGGGSPPGDREERARLSALRLTEGFERRGSLPEDEISRLLATAEFAIWAQGKLSVTKSGTFMACAAHGLNVISCYADAAAPEPLSLLISPNELMKGIPAAELQWRAARLREWQEHTSAWPQIAREIAGALQIKTPTS